MDEETILERARKEPWNYGGALLAMYDALAARHEEVCASQIAATRECDALTARLAAAEQALRMALNQDGDHSPACACRLCAAERELNALRRDAEFGRAVLDVLAQATAPTLSQWAAVQSEARKLRSALEGQP